MHWYELVWTLVAFLGIFPLGHLTLRAYHNWQLKPQVSNAIVTRQVELLGFARFRSRLVMFLVFVIFSMIGTLTLAKAPASSTITIFGLILAELIIFFVIGVWDYIDARRFDRLDTGRRWWEVP